MEMQKQDIMPEDLVEEEEEMRTELRKKDPR